MALFLLPRAAWTAGKPEIPLSEPGEWSGNPVVRTRFGSIRGMEDEDGTWVWKAVPFAKPPAGGLRWRAPRDPEPWQGVRISYEFSGPCTQFNPVLGWIIEGGEDCLYLNVWRPRTSERNLPVYVWIHGGGNSIGSAVFVPDYYGNRLAAASDMVFVSVNYRLGPLGWFSHPALREGASAEDDSGNYGTLDLIHALRWIRGNISAFGGDAGNVTVAGESAGAMNILSLIISPAAKGLFSRAVIQSGVPSVRSMDEAEESAQAALALLLFRDGGYRNLKEAGAAAASLSPARVRSYLRSKTDREILRCYSGGTAGMTGNPAILADGYVIPRKGFAALDDGSYPNKVPVIIGSNAEELKIFLFLNPVLSGKEALFDSVATYGSLLWAADGVDAVARKLSAARDQPPVFAYRFTWGMRDAEGRSPLPGEWGRRLGAFHSLEVPFFLGTDTINGPMTPLVFTKENEPGRKALSAAIMAYTASFARTGNPNGAGSGLQIWEPWSNDPGGAKAAILNAEGDSAHITMSVQEYTVDGLLGAMKSGLAPGLYEETLRFIGRSPVPGLGE